MPLGATAQTNAAGWFQLIPLIPESAWSPSQGRSHQCTRVPYPREGGGGGTGLRVSSGQWIQGGYKEG